MADTKISGLPASTTPLAGTEELPIVQSGVTRKVSVANLTAGRAISATQLTLTTGNLIVASGQGVDFSATPGTGTSELLSDYEEGTFSPSLAFGGGSTGITYTTQAGIYTRIGRTVTIRFEVELSNKGSSTGTATITGLPYSAAALTPVLVYLYSGFSATYETGVAYIGTNIVYEIASFGTASFTDTNFTNTSRFWAVVTYQV